MDQLKEFDLVFYLALNVVSKDENIEDIIIKQHKVVKENNVHPKEVKAIVEGGDKGPSAPGRIRWATR